MLKINPLELIQTMRLDKQSSFWFRRRRHPDWTDNYTLYRDKVQLNRLTQRQSVNIPLMKYSIKTLLKSIDDAPLLYFTCLNNDEQKEIYYNEYYRENMEFNKTIIKDIVDKRQVLLFGRSFKKQNIVNGRHYWEVVDPQDMGVDRYVDPANLDSARFIFQEHIYKPLSWLKSNPFYNQKAVAELEAFYQSDEGLIKAEANQLDFVEKQKRMASMGVIDVFAPIQGETMVELNEWTYKLHDDQLGEEVNYFIATAENYRILCTYPLEDIIGQTSDNYWRYHSTWSTWADDVERTDFWSDGVADTLRTPNKILNAFFSQMVENRTLRNYGMQYYNSSLSEEGFMPQTFVPEAWGWYPIPVGEGGKLGDSMMHVDIQPLEDNLEEMNFLLNIAEKASAATSFQQGEASQQQITLGEVQLLLANAQERVKSMAIFYTDAWKEFGTKYIKLLEAAPHLFDAQTVNKKGRLTKKMYTKVIGPADFHTKEGYMVDVKMMSEVMSEDADSLQKLQAARVILPNNKTLDDIYKKKILQFADLNSEEVSEVLKEDKQNQEKQPMNPMMQPGQQPNQMLPGAQPPVPPTNPSQQLLAAGALGTQPIQ